MGDDHADVDDDSDCTDGDDDNDDDKLPPLKKGIWGSLHTFSWMIKL